MSNNIPKPAGKPVTLSTLYASYTQDTKAPEELVRTVLRQDTDSRLLVVSLRLRGFSNVQIAGALGVRPRSVIGQVSRAMFAAWKVIHNKPRYYKIGRKKNE